MKLIIPDNNNPIEPNWFGKCSCICQTGTAHAGVQSSANWNIGGACRCGCFEDNIDNSNANHQLAYDRD